MPTPETLAEYYGAYRQDCACKLTFFNPQRFANHILRIAGDHWHVPQMRILDFGGADGSLAIAIAERVLEGAQARVESIHIDVIDYSQEPKQPQNHDISIRRLRSLQEVKAKAYDLVIASAVMEHIPEPKLDYQDLLQAVKVGGYLYARTPWIAPVLKLIGHLGIKSDFTFPAHVHDLGKAFWEGLPSRLGLSDTEIRLRCSQPSIVETRFSEAPIRTLVAYVMKFPWRIMPNQYTLVGGWEIVFERLR